MKRIPILPTLLVLIAAGVMVRLGFWQLDRLAQKEAMLARYEAAASRPADAPVELDEERPDQFAYRTVRWGCPTVGPDQMVAGRNSAGDVGWAHTVVCTHSGFDYGEHAAVTLGWSRDPQPVVWKGGEFIGTLVPMKKSGIALPEAGRGPTEANVNLDFHIVANPPLAGLQPNATPDPRDIPNNHFSYAVQWFLFAGVALVIYALALRKRLREQG